MGRVIGGVLFGWLGDRVGRKNSLLWTLGLFSVGAIVSAFAWDFNSLLVTRAITGIGLGGEWGAGIVLFNEVWDKNRRGFGSSVVQAASTGGIAAASIVAVWSLTTFSPDWGWRVALLTGGAPILLMIYVRFWMPELKLWLEYERMRAAGELPPEKAKAANPLIEIFKGASLRYTLLGFLIVSGYMFAFYSVAVFMPGLMRSLGAEPRGDPNRYNRTLVGSRCGIPFGSFTDSLGRKVGVVFPMIISVIGFIGIYFSTGTSFPGSLIAWPLFAWYVLWGIGQTAAGMFGCWFSELYPVELRASAVSTIYMVGRGIGGSQPPFFAPRGRLRRWNSRRNDGGSRRGGRLCPCCTAAARNSRTLVRRD